MDVLEVLHVTNIVSAAVTERQRAIRKYLTDFQNPLEYLTDEQFIERYRLNKAGVIGFMEYLQQDLENESGRGLPLPPILMFLVVLRFYATGSFQLVTGDLESVSQPTVSRLVKYISTAIGSKYSDFIKFPEGESAAREASRFFQNSGFPGVVGAIDCTHIKIQSPGGDAAELYRNRKRLFSLNVQAVCNSDMIFTNLVARWRGSVHDSRIFLNSLLRQNFEDGRYNGILLGDNGYGCKRYLMTPFLVPQNDGEKRYNRALIKSRTTIERTFGVWKRIFPCLSLGLRTCVDTSMAIIVATAVLYNYARMSR